ncbi:MAG: SufE family protein [Thermoleophilia bacterium]
MIPGPLQEIVDDFAASPRELRLQMLLDYSRTLPRLPERYADQSTLERVHECQSPFFLAVELDDQRHVRVFFDAPEEAPTTRGYAGILAEGLTGATPEQVLETPATFFTAMGLGELISPLRLRGMGAILAHIKRRVVELGGTPA